MLAAAITADTCVTNFNLHHTRQFFSYFVCVCVFFLDEMNINLLLFFFHYSLTFHRFVCLFSHRMVSSFFLLVGGVAANQRGESERETDLQSFMDICRQHLSTNTMKTIGTERLSIVSKCL